MLSMTNLDRQLPPLSTTFLECGQDFMVPRRRHSHAGYSSFLQSFAVVDADLQLFQWKGEEEAQDNEGPEMWPDTDSEYGLGYEEEIIRTVTPALVAHHQMPLSAVQPWAMPDACVTSPFPPQQSPMLWPAHYSPCWQDQGQRQILSTSVVEQEQAVRCCSTTAEQQQAMLPQDPIAVAEQLQILLLAAREAAVALAASSAPGTLSNGQGESEPLNQKPAGGPVLLGRRQMYGPHGSEAQSSKTASKAGKATLRLHGLVTPQESAESAESGERAPQNAKVKVQVTSNFTQSELISSLDRNGVKDLHDSVCMPGTFGSAKKGVAFANFRTSGAEALEAGQSKKVPHGHEEAGLDSNQKCAVGGPLPKHHGPPDAAMAKPCRPAGKKRQMLPATDLCSLQECFQGDSPSSLVAAMLAQGAALQAKLARKVSESPRH